VSSIKFIPCTVGSPTRNLSTFATVVAQWTLRLREGSAQRRGDRGR